MSLLQQILDAAVDSSQPITPALRRVFLLGNRLDNKLLREWANHELNGYSYNLPLPPYRGQSLDVHSVFEGQLLPYDGQIAPFHLRDPIATYEQELSDLASGSDGYFIPCPPEIRSPSQSFTYKLQVSRWNLRRLIEGVRTSLFHFAVELEKEAPEAGEVPASQLPISAERISKIIHTTIYTGVTYMDDHSTHVGTAGNVVGGQGNVVRQGNASVVSNSADLRIALDELRHAVQLLPTEEIEIARHLVEAVRKEALREKPRREVIANLLKSVAAVATTAGTAGAAVIEAVQAIHRAIGS